MVSPRDGSPPESESSQIPSTSVASQTKTCPTCFVKFTKATHLSRHMRSHTNERFYRCGACKAEFTRSDLLSRHKKTCGGSSSGKSKQKSCQACAESKIKCDLFKPCSKCVSKGKECVFLNDPAESREKLENGDKRIRPSDQKRVKETTTNPNTPMEVTPAPMEPAPTAIAPGHPHSSSESYSPASEESREVDMIAQELRLPLDPSTMTDGNLQGGLFDLPSQMFDSTRIQGYLWHEFASRQLDSLQPADHQTQPLNQLAYLPDMGIPPPSQSPSGHELTPTVTAQSAQSAQSTSAQSTSGTPTDEELQTYFNSFTSTFLKQVPLIYRPIWDFKTQPPVVTEIMHACGALFLQHDRQKAATFVDRTLKNTFSVVVPEFNRRIKTGDESGIISLIYAILLLQHIGFFSLEFDHRELASIYHGMVVTMVRRSGLLQKAASWVPSDLSNPANLDTAWRSWAQQEMIKRALFGAFVQDCCQCIYFSLPPMFRFEDFDFALPCDDALWNTSSMEEWRDVLSQPSFYGTGTERAAGLNFPAALASLTEVTEVTQQTTRPPNPSAYIILIHALLRNLYLPSADPSAKNPNVHFTTQFALYNWMRLWLDNPECRKSESGPDEPPLCCNVLPFYWLAQTTLFAIQEGTPIAGAKFFTGGQDIDKLSEMKGWIERIRSKLRAGAKIAAMDLMQVK